jgi:hypothetical protein
MKKILVLFSLFIILPLLSYGQQTLVKPAISPNFASYDFWVGSNETWNELTISPLPWKWIKPLGVRARIGSLGNQWNEWDRISSEVEYIVQDIEIMGTKVGNFGGRWGGVYSTDLYIQNYYGYLLYSTSISSFDIHANVGTLSTYQGREWTREITTGIRGDYRVTTRITIIGEVVGYDLKDFLLQKGIRYTLISDTIWIHLSAGNNFEFRNKKARPWLLYTYPDTGLLVYDASKSRDMNLNPELPFFNLGFSFIF